MSESKKPLNETASSPETSSPEEMTYEKANHRKLVSNIVFLVAASAALLAMFLSLGEIGTISKAFGSIATGTNYLYLLIAIGAALVFYILYPLSLCILNREMKTNISYMDSYLIGSSEHFFNGITPFAAGGQPFQIYAYTKRGLSSDKATGLILGNFIIFLTVINIYGIASLFFFRTYALGMDLYTVSWLKWFSLVGFVFNLGFLAFIIALGFSHKLANFLVKAFKWFTTWKFIGHRFAKQVPIFEQYCTNVQDVMNQLMHHWKGALWAFFVKIVDYAFYYGMIFFLVKAVGISIPYEEFGVYALSGAFAAGASVWMPTPGGTGGLEYAMALVLCGPLGASVSMGTSFVTGIGVGETIALLWRMLTYYLMMILSGISNLIFEGRFHHSMRKQLNFLREIKEKHEKKESEAKEKKDAEMTEGKDQK